MDRSVLEKLLCISGYSHILLHKSYGPRKSRFGCFDRFFGNFELFSKTTLPKHILISIERTHCGKLPCLRSCTLFTRKIITLGNFFDVFKMVSFFTNYPPISEILISIERTRFKKLPCLSGYDNFTHELWPSEKSRL